MTPDNNFENLRTSSIKLYEQKYDSHRFDILNMYLKNDNFEAGISRIAIINLKPIALKRSEK